MPSVLPLTLRAGALPPNAKLTPQQFLDLLPSVLEIMSQQDFALFTTGSVEPSYNAGPFLKDGVTWRVWSDSVGGYRALILEQESLRYVISAASPADNSDYDVWIKLDGSGKAQGIHTWFGGAWVDVYEDVFYSKTEVDNLVAASTPSGTIQMFGGNAAPTGYLLCDGSAVSRTTYAALFAVLGTTYGAGDLTTTFNVPDMRGRAPVGVGIGDATDATTWNRGDKKGTEGVTLTIAQLPAHSHEIWADNSNRPAGYDRNQSFGTPGVDTAVAGEDFGQAYISDNADDTQIIADTGSGNAHSSLQPSLTVNFIIKT